MEDYGKNHGMNYESAVKVIFERPQDEIYKVGLDHHLGAHLFEAQLPDLPAAFT
jgi:hypothetical protein